MAPTEDDLGDLLRLIRVVETRRSEIMQEAGAAFDRRVGDATILLGKLWVAVMGVRLGRSR